ncbi:alpha/beta fold hydrolase [Serinibacter arcticus]|uniref:Alpha/beta hydrolase fold n=1 Tax=Serinibacter arcticus TaxID=1655435 RepID=A0A4Z1E2R2_9MICO|nr:alpha/beta hydrolase [Serinibacter arcticus]TGO05509.1 alpha/beta hydrolase fold [Serinibacter arcticus]
MTEVLAHTLHGDGGAPVLVLLHAFPLSSRTWDPLLPHLREWRVLTIDLPGLGASGVPTTAPSMAAVASLVAATMTAAGVEAATVLGLSTGGYVALQLAADHPDRVTALALSSTSVGVGAPDDPEQRRRDAARLRAEDSIGPVADSEDDALGATSRREQPELLEAVREIIADTSAAGAAWLAEAIATRAPRADTLEAFAGPVLLLFGEEDTATPPDRELPAMEGARRGDERTRVARLPRTGHLTATERPVAVAGELSWLRAHAGT